MANTQHSALTGSNIHVVHAYTFADQSERLAATTIITSSLDVGKVAFQTDERSFWAVQNHSPLTWLSLAGGTQFVSGSDPGASYIVVSLTSSLANERALAVSTGLRLTDGGANNNVTLSINDGIVATISGSTFIGPVSASGGLSGSLQQVGPGLPYLLAQGSITITTQSNGQIVISGSGGSGGGSSSGGADPGASYIVVSNTGSLANERALVVGPGLLLTDGGANTGITASINNNVVATLTGSTFTGPVSASGGLSGSLQQVGPGLSYLVAGSNVAILSQSNGQVVISATGGGGGSGGSSGWVDGGGKQKTTGSISIDGSNAYADAYGNDVFLYVSGSRNINGSQARKAVFGGDAVFSGSLSATMLTGSLQKLVTGESYLVAGSGISITSQSNGQVQISSSGSIPSPLTVGQILISTGSSGNFGFVAASPVTSLSSGWLLNELGYLIVA